MFKIASYEDSAPFGGVSDFTFLPKLGSLMWILSVLLLLLPFASAKSRKCSQHKHLQKKADLFPAMDRASIYHRESPRKDVEDFPKLCSTGLTTRLLPFKNEKGEIEWIFSEDVQPGNELDVFKVQPAQTPATQSKPLQKNPSEILSPVTSNSSNNESLTDSKQDYSVSPQVNTPASTSSEDQKDDREENGVHNCPHCDASFKMRGYLTRHLKKHSSDKAYRCPFHNSSIYKDEHDNSHKCHPNGGFSRRDTYKTHLKSRHFIYPPGTSIKDRVGSSGNCSMCGDFFENAEIWTEVHIEGAECKHLPPGFKGKSRIKNRMKKQMARLAREQKQLMKKSEGKLKQEQQSPDFSTPSSINTPMLNSFGGYEYERSPTYSVSSSVGQQTTANPTQMHNQMHKQMHHPHPHGKHKFHHRPCHSKTEADYDDDFCLDTEQLSLPSMSAERLPGSQYEVNDYPVFDYGQYNNPMLSHYIH